MPADALSHKSADELVTEVTEALLDLGYYADTAESTQTGIRNVLAALAVAGYIVVQQGALSALADACDVIAAATPDLPAIEPLR